MMDDGAAEGLREMAGSDNADSVAPRTLLMLPIVLAAFGALLVLPAVVRWITAALLYGWRLPRAALQFARNVQFSRHRHLLPTSLSAMLAALFLLYVEQFGLAIAVFVVAISVAGHLLAPPGILFLGPSGGGTVKLVAQLDATALHFYGVTCLLDPALPDRVHWPVRMDVEDVTLRTVHDKHWEQVVRNMLEVVKVVVIDCRRSSVPSSLSPGVEQELVWIAVHSDWWRKTICYVDSPEDAALVKTMAAKAVFDRFSPGGSRPESSRGFGYVSSVGGLAMLVDEVKALFKRV